MRHKKTYREMENSHADMTGRPAYSVRHPDGYSDNEYSHTHNTSIKQQNGAKYTESECDNTQKMSMAGKLIRVQAEQIRENPAEYIARKFNTRGDADGDNKGTASGLPE